MSIQDPFLVYQDPGPRYAGLSVYSAYIPARDGTRLAADVYLPANLRAADRLPAILCQTRYWRSLALRSPINWLFRGEGDQIPMTRRGKAFFVSRGYAVVMVDVRGTGASFGVCHYPWESVTVQDAYDILDWIVAQPWSNGKAAGVGISFLGTTAELLLATHHPALQAVVPQFNHPDPFVDIALPGGLLNERFLCAWTETNEKLDRNQAPAQFGRLLRWISQGVRPVGGRQGMEDLRAALRMHLENGGQQDLDQMSTFRDEPHVEKEYSLDDQSVMRFREAILQSNVPVYGWGSWMDAGTGDAVIRRYLTLPGPQLAVIGAWNHGGLRQASPYAVGKAPLSPSPAVIQREILRFLEASLNEPAGQPENALYYYTLGAETWQQTSTWPPAGVQMERWFLAPDHRLSLQPAPDGAGVAAGGNADRYVVDFRASTGLFNRWWELGTIQGKTVDYGNRALQKPLLIGYESPVLEEDLEITGYPVIRLFVASTEPDCAFYVYLEDVFPDGRIAYVTEGQLRALHRKVLPPEESPYHLQVPYHSFCKKDALPLQPGEVAEITFGLLPVSVLIRRGHRIRVALAGHDEGNFIRVPAQGTPVWSIQRSPQHPSSIDLPVKRRG